MTGNNLLSKRRALGITGTVLCAQLKMSPGYLSNIEREVVVPSTEKLQQISDALDDLGDMKIKINELAAGCGWPVRAIT